jgi:hypothetical protein
MKKLITAILAIAISFNVLANEQCTDEQNQIIAMQERSLNQGTIRNSSVLAYVRITAGSSAMIYAVVNSATGIGLLGFVIFLGGSLDIYINSENDEEIEKLTKNLCT